MLDTTALVIPSRLTEWMRCFARDVAAHGREGWVRCDEMDDGASFTCADPDHRVCWLRREVPYV